MEKSHRSSYKFTQKHILSRVLLCGQARRQWKKVLQISVVEEVIVVTEKSRSRFKVTRRSSQSLHAMLSLGSEEQYCNNEFQREFSFKETENSHSKILNAKRVQTPTSECLVTPSGTSKLTPGMAAVKMQVCYSWLVKSPLGMGMALWIK